MTGRARWLASLEKIKRNRELIAPAAAAPSRPSLGVIERDGIADFVAALQSGDDRATRELPIARSPDRSVALAIRL